MTSLRTVLPCRRHGALWRHLSALVVICSAATVLFLYTTTGIRSSSNVALATLRDRPSRDRMRFRSREELRQLARSDGDQMTSNAKTDPVVGDMQFRQSADDVDEQSSLLKQPAVSGRPLDGRRKGHNRTRVLAEDVRRQVDDSAAAAERRIRPGNSADDTDSASRQKADEQRSANDDSSTDARNRRVAAAAAAGDIRQLYAYRPTSVPPRGVPLRGGPGKCRVYDVRRQLPEAADFTWSDCVRLKSYADTRPPAKSDGSAAPRPPPPPLLVCPYPNDVDVHLSKPLRTHGVWEPHVVRVFVAAVSRVVSDEAAGGRSSTHVGVYDIGANVGQYSVLAAGALGRRVVAVEPYRPNIYRLHKAVGLNGLEDRVIIVENAVSDIRDTFELSVVDGNPSGVVLTSQDADRYCNEPECPAHATTIFMDDLLEVTNFDVAVMKIDIEGFEHRAFVHSDQLMSEVRIDYIFMEWTRMRDYHGSEVDNTEDKRLVQGMVNRLSTAGYTAYGVNELQRLDPRYWYGWPHDVVWVRANATTPSQLVDNNQF